MYYMSLMITPPVRPKGFGKKPNKYYTLHTGVNNIFALSIDESDKTSVVGFKKKDDANFISGMIETYYIEMNEWPEMNNGSMYLPVSKNNGFLQHIAIVEVDFEDLKIICTRNILNLISVDNIITIDDKYSFSGNLYKFDAPISFYKDRFQEFM